MSTNILNDRNNCKQEFLSNYFDQKSLHFKFNEICFNLFFIFSSFKFETCPELSALLNNKTMKVFLISAYQNCTSFAMHDNHICSFPPFTCVWHFGSQNIISQQRPCNFYLSASCHRNTLDIIFQFSGFSTAIGVNWSNYGNRWCQQHREKEKFHNFAFGEVQKQKQKANIDYRWGLDWPGGDDKKQGKVVKF